MRQFRFIGTDEVFEAHQFLDDEHEDLTRAYPRWFIDLLTTGRIEHHSRDGWYLDRKRKLNNESWIVVDPSVDGGFVVMTDPYLKEHFEEV